MTIGRRHVLALVPLGIAAAVGTAFWKMLGRMQSGQFDPHDIGNPMLGRKVPDFALPGLDGDTGFDLASLKEAAAHQPIVVNFYASWCVPCVQESDVLGRLAASGTLVWGVAYEDKPDKLRTFLNKYGNPYKRLAADTDGRVAIDWGVYGVPETFLIDRAGTIRWHKAGPLTADAVQDELMPALRSVA